MTKRKIRDLVVQDSTLLGDIHGIGHASFLALGVAGFNVHQRTTFKEFKTITQSFDHLRASLLKDGQIDARYVIPKFRTLWNGNGATVSKKHKTGGTGGEAKEAHEVVSVNPEVLGVQQAEVQMDADKNFLLQAKPNEGPETAKNPDTVTNNIETPEVDAMDRHPTMDHAVATGDIAAKVTLSVIPDQELVVAPTDKNINAPLEVLPDAPIPILPAEALGANVGGQMGSRMVEPQTLEQKQLEDNMAEDLPSVKANGEKDLGGDGVGTLTIDNAESDKNKSEESSSKSSSNTGQFEFVPVEHQSNNSSSGEEEVKETNPDDDTRTASNHPFKQPSLFRNHDMAAASSKCIQRSEMDMNTLAQASIQSANARGSEWHRYNAATQGVRMTDMPVLATNFLQVGPLMPDYQMLGANPLQNIFSPSPFEMEAALGRFH